MRFENGIVIVLFALLVLFGASAMGAGLPSSPNQAMTSQLAPIAQLMKKLVDEDKAAPGIAILLAQDGKIIFKQAHGLADIKSNRPLSVSSINFLASTSKPISTTCLMMLVDEGKISLDDPVSKYLPEFKRFDPCPTIRQCLSHTSGIFDNRQMTPDENRASRYQRYTLAQAVSKIANIDLEYPVGEFFAYGGASFMVAGRVLEVVSGKTFDAFMKERLLDPLGMMNTSWHPDESLADRVSTTYRPAGDGFKRWMVYTPKAPHDLIRPPGGLYSTLDDVAIFLQMQLNNGQYAGKRIISPEAAKEMTTRQTKDAQVGFSPSFDTNYGLGFMLEYTPEGALYMARHDGAAGSAAWIDYRRGLVGVIFSNIPNREALHAVHGPIMELAEKLIPEK